MCCISVNDETVAASLARGVCVTVISSSLDVTAELDGFTGYADACITVALGLTRARDSELSATARHALAAGLGVARAGARAGALLNAIVQAIEQTVIARGHAVCPELMGHGIGRRIHELPYVPNVFNPTLTEPLTDGLVLTIEPIISAGTGQVRATRDGWTVVTADGSRTADVEHTIVVRCGDPLVLTA